LAPIDYRNHRLTTALAPIDYRIGANSPPHWRGFPPAGAHDSPSNSTSPDKLKTLAKLGGFRCFFFNGPVGVIFSGAMRGLHFWDFMLSQRR